MHALRLVGYALTQSVSMARHAEAFIWLAPAIPRNSGCGTARKHGGKLRWRAGVQAEAAAAERDFWAECPATLYPRIAGRFGKPTGSIDDHPYPWRPHRRRAPSTAATWGRRFDPATSLGVLT